MNDLTYIFDQLTQEELDVLLSENIRTQISLDKVRRIQKLTLKKARLGKYTGSRTRIIAGIAAAVVLLIISGGFIAIRAEAREYEAAARFFREKDLTPDGLTREEMKEVYRDITTNTFRAEKTGAILKNSIGGYLIKPEEQSPEALMKLWHYQEHQRESENDGAEEKRSYTIHTEFRMDDELGFEVFDRSIIECYQEETLQYAAEFTDFLAEGWTALSDGIIVYGSTYRYSSEDGSPAWILKIDHEGKILWKHCLEHGFQTETVTTVIEEEDGNFVVIGKGLPDKQVFGSQLVFSRYSPDGSELLVQKTTVGDSYGIWNAAPYQQGYLVQVGSYVENQFARIVMLDENGKVSGDLNYDAGDMQCCVQSMTAFADKIYLSGYLYQKGENGSLGGGSYEVQPIVDQVIDGSVKAIDISDAFRLQNGEITQEEYENLPDELTPLLREYYRGILIVCDPETGRAESFYEVPGALGEKLSINRYGQMEWDTGSFRWTMTTLMFNSSTIQGQCAVTRYTFDTDGSLICEEQTEETTDYRR